MAFGSVFLLVGGRVRALMPLGFAGGLHDRDIGWVRFGFRDYDPETGRFTAPDPMGYAAGDPDVYGYCLDDPVNNIDPAGLEVRVYNRKATGPVGITDGNHAYLHSTDENRTSGMGASSGYDSTAHEDTSRDSYNVVPNPKGVPEKEIMDYMDEIKNDGIWFPYLNDCHNKVDKTLNHFGLTNPGAPGGRLGTIPHRNGGGGF